MEKGRRATSTQVCKVYSPLSSSSISLAAVLLVMCDGGAERVAVFHGDYTCDLCVNRNESAERFSLAYDTPLCSSCLYRYHRCAFAPAQMDTYKIAVFRYTVCMHTFRPSISLNTDLSIQSDTDHTRVSSAGVGGAEVVNVSPKMCRHPCEELVEVLTEIHGLRIVTSNLLDDLDRVVRCYICICAHVSSACWNLFVFLVQYLY